MIIIIKKDYSKLFKNIRLFFVLFAFLTNTIIPSVYAQGILSAAVNLPSPSRMVMVGEHYNPMLIEGLNLVPQNPLMFDFIIDTGDTALEGKDFEQEAKRLVKYFLAALTVPDQEKWVNLSPYEPDRIIPKTFGQTEDRKSVV